MKPFICFLVLVFSLAVWLFPSESMAKGPEKANDLNPDPNIVEIELVASETNIRLTKGVKKTRMWTSMAAIQDQL